MRILWITGPPGVGKSTAAWRLYERLDPPVSHVDIDQLRMLAPAGTSARTTVTRRALLGLADVHERGGSRQLVVSGVGMPDADLGVRVVRLRADAAELRRRLVERGAGEDYVREALDEAAVLDERPDPPGTAVVDTTRRGPDDVLEVVIPHAHAARDDDTTPGPAETAALEEVVWIRSSRAVGASTAGFGLWTRLAQGPRPASFLDPVQLTFLRGGTARRIDALASVAEAHASAGSRRVVAVGPLAPSELADLERRAAAVHVIRLTAAPDRIADRVRLRAAGGPVHLAGDPLRGLAGSALDTAIADAVQKARTAVPLPGEHTIDTTDLTATDAVDRIAGALGELAGKITER